MKLYVRLEAPFEWVRVTGHTVEAFGEVPSSADYPLADEDELIGVVPGEWVTVHQVNLPARSKRQFLTALPYALEDAVSEEVDQLHFSCHAWRAGSAVVVHVASKDKMRYWQSLANDSSLPLDRLVPDYSLLPLHDAAESTLAVSQSAVAQGTEIIAHHKNGGGACLDADFVSLWLADLPVNETVAVADRELAEQLIEDYPDRDFRLWEVGGRLAHWLEHSEANAIDLMGDEFRPSVRKFNWQNFKLPAALAAAAVMLVVAFDVYRYFALHREIRSVLDQQAVALQQAFPEIQDVPDGSARPLMERALQNRVGEPEDHNATSLLAVTAQVMRQQKVSLTEVTFRDGRLTITCALNDLSQVDQITRGLNAKPRVNAQLDSSANDEGQILASYTLEATS